MDLLQLSLRDMKYLGAGLESYFSDYAGADYWAEVCDRPWLELLRAARAQQDFCYDHWFQILDLSPEGVDDEMWDALTVVLFITQEAVEQGDGWYLDDAGTSWNKALSLIGLPPEDFS